MSSEPFLQVVDLALGPGQWPVHWNRRQLAGWRLLITGVRFSEVDPSGQQQGWLLVRQPRLAAEQLGQELGDGHDGEGILVDQEGARVRARQGGPGQPVQRSVRRHQHHLHPLQVRGQRFPQPLPQLRARVRFPGRRCLAGAVAGPPTIDQRGQGLRRPERDDHHLRPLGPDHERHHPRLFGWLGLSLRRRLQVEVIDQVDQSAALGQGRPDLT